MIHNDTNVTLTRKMTFYFSFKRKQKITENYFYVCCLNQFVAFISFFMIVASLVLMDRFKSESRHKGTILRNYRKVSISRGGHFPIIPF